MMTSNIPENYRKVAHRYDQYKQVEVTVFYGKLDKNAKGTFFVTTNNILAGPYTRGEIEATMECLNIDLDFKSPAVIG